MNSSKSSALKSSTVVMTCHGCSMSYYDYRRLLEHLYWKHGTESYWCNKCGLKRWRYAAHICHVLPFEDKENVEATNESQYCSERETDFCFCGKFVEEAAMIGCDGPNCVYQWYHFACVGIVSAPDGDWLCPECAVSGKFKKRRLNKNLET